jgi:hypothetical protein
VDTGRIRSDASVNRELACLSHLFSKAVEWEMMEESPFRKMRRLFFKENNQRTRFLTEDEIKNLLAVDSTAARIMGFNPKKIPYLLAAGSHFRGLQESDVACRGERPGRFAGRFSCLPQFASAQL